MKSHIKIKCGSRFEDYSDTCVVILYINNKKAGEVELYKERPKRFFITGVSVRGKYRGLGYGVKMMKSVGKFADKKGWTLSLEAYPHLVHFYNLVGFKVYKINERRAYMTRKPSI